MEMVVSLWWVLIAAWVGAAFGIVIMAIFKVGGQE